MKISNVRRGFSALATAVAAAAATFLIASPALSDWWVTYDVTGALRTLTPLEVQIDSLVKTNVLAGWSDGTSTTNTDEIATFAIYNGASVTPGSVTYPSGEFPTLNQNQIQLHF